MRGFAYRLRRLLKWVLSVVIVTSGGSTAVLVLVWKLPLGIIIQDGSGGSLGFLMGISFVLGTAVSATLYWLVTGKSPGDALFGGL